MTPPVAGNNRRTGASSGLIKQPWPWPVACQCLDPTPPLDAWHTLKFIHVEDRLIGANNDDVMFDVHDNHDANCSAVDHRGHKADPRRCISEK